MNYYKGNTITIEMNGTTPDDDLASLDFAVWIYCAATKKSPIMIPKEDMDEIIAGLFKFTISATTTATMPAGIYTLEVKIRNVDGSATGLVTGVFSLDECVSRDFLN